MTDEAKHNDNLVYVINIYASVSYQSILVREDLFQLLYNYIHPDMVNILGEDFNTTDNPLLHIYPPNPKTTEIAELTDLCHTCDIRDSFRTLHLNKQNFSWRGPHSASRWIVYTSTRTLKSFRHWWNPAHTLIMI